MSYNDYTGEFEYTKDFFVSSSLVDAVYYNENEQVLALDLDDEIYVYENVPAEAVVTLVAGGEHGSVGRHYNRVFKTLYGPGEHVGDYMDTDFVQVSREVDLTEPVVYRDTSASGQSTKEFSLGSVEVKTPDVVSVSTKEFSLAPLLEKGVSNVEGSDGAFATVVFTLDSAGDKEFRYEAETSDVYEAVEELHDYVARIGATGKVRRVVVEFE